MNKVKLMRIAISACAALAATTIQAAPVEFAISSTVTLVEGSYAGAIEPGHTIIGSFIVDNDTANAGPGSDPNPSFNPGHEYSSFWSFPGSPYGVSLFEVQLGSGFDNTAPAAVVVNNNLTVTSEQTGGMVPTGTYDWIELLGSNTIDHCDPPAPCTPADGEEWTLAIFSTTSWLSADDALPDAPPASMTAFLIGIEFDSVGTETGIALAQIDSLTVSAVPLPAAVWFLFSGVAALGFIRRRK